MSERGAFEAAAGFLLMAGTVVAIGQNPSYISVTGALSQSMLLRLSLTWGMYFMYCRICYEVFTPDLTPESTLIYTVKICVTMVAYLAMMATVSVPESSLHAAMAGSTFMSMLTDLALLKGAWPRMGAIVCAFLTTAMPTSSKESFKKLELAFGLAFCSGVAMGSIAELASWIHSYLL